MPNHNRKGLDAAQMQAAIDRGPHTAALAHFVAEVEEKVRLGQARVVDSIKHNPPPQLKISPVAAIPHNSKLYRSILDLSFRLRLQEGGHIPAVNDTTLKTAPAGAIDQIGHSLKRLIHAFAEADVEGGRYSWPSGILKMVFGGWISRRGRSGTLHMLCHNQRGPR